ncbi:hypothetical protein F5Y13DRAFT_73993 [Hypoxylon sp. FL1857]|nr:hypothetical protein F5Y13DRAFT_73993 [Hypoxylon sp. FL1857]
MGRRVGRLGLALRRLAAISVIVWILSASNNITTIIWSISFPRIALTLEILEIPCCDHDFLVTVILMIGKLVLVASIAWVSTGASVGDVSHSCG